MGLLGDLVVRIVGDTAQFGGELKKSEAQFKKVTDNLNKMGKKLTTFVTLPILGIGTAAIKAAADFEKQRVAFETMLGSADKAKVLLQEIEAFSATTPFQLPGLLTASKRLLAFGVAAGDIVETMRRLGNAAQGDQAILDRLTLAFGKLRAKGKATMEELNMFTEAGVPIIQALADEYEVTTQELFKLVETGKVGFEDVNTAITNLTTGQGQFAGLIEKQSETLIGLFSTMKDNVVLLAKAFGDILLPFIKNLVSGFTDFIKRFQAMDESQKRLLVTILGIAAAIGPALLVISKMVTAFGILKAAVLATNAALAANPWGLIAIAITGLVVGFIALNAAMKDANEYHEGAIDLSKDFEDATKDETQAILEKNVAVQRSRVVGLAAYLERLIELKAVAQNTRAQGALAIQIENTTKTLKGARVGLQEANNQLVKFVEEGLKAAEEEARELSETTGELTDDQKDYLAALKKITTGFKEVDEKAKIYGADIDVLSEKKSILKSAINSLIEKGFTVEGGAITALIEKYGFLLEEKEKVEEKTIDQIRSYEILAGTQDELARGMLAGEKVIRKHREGLDEMGESSYNLADAMSSLADTIAGPVTTSMEEGLGFMGEALINSEAQVKSFKEVVKDMISSMLSAIGKWLIAQAAILFTPLPPSSIVGGIAALAGAAAAFTAAGAVKQLQEGGIVTRPTVAMIGEKGPEAVVPLDKGPIHLTVNLGSRVLYDEITKGIKNRQIRIEQ